MTSPNLQGLRHHNSFSLNQQPIEDTSTTDRGSELDQLRLRLLIQALPIPVINEE